MKTLILAAIRYSLMLLPECGLMPLSVPAPEKPLCTQPVTSCTRSRLTRRLVKYFAQMRRPSSYTSVVKIGLHVYEVRPCEGHRNVGFRCAAVWSAVVAKVTGAIGYTRHQSRLRDALIRQHSMRYKKLVVFTALALPALTHLSAVAQTCPDNVPHITGTWTVLPYQMPIQPISANLLRNGKVLLWRDRSMTQATTQKVRIAIAGQCGIQAARMRRVSAFRILPTTSFAAGRPLCSMGDR